MNNHLLCITFSPSSGCIPHEDVNAGNNNCTTPDDRYSRVADSSECPPKTETPPHPPLISHAQSRNSPCGEPSQRTLLKEASSFAESDQSGHTILPLAKSSHRADIKFTDRSMIQRPDCIPYNPQRLRGFLCRTHSSLRRERQLLPLAPPPPPPPTETNKQTKTKHKNKLGSHNKV